MVVASRDIAKGNRRAAPAFARCRPCGFSQARRRGTTVAI